MSGAIVWVSFDIQKQDMKTCQTHLHFWCDVRIFLMAQVTCCPVHESLGEMLDYILRTHSHCRGYAQLTIHSRYTCTWNTALEEDLSLIIPQVPLMSRPVEGRRQCRNNVDVMVTACLFVFNFIVQCVHVNAEVQVLL